MKTRTEFDSIGHLEVPKDAYYGVQTLRAMENFQISGRKLHPKFIESLVTIKKAAAMTNCKAGHLDSQRASAIIMACAVNLSKICNDLRLLSSGPRTGVHEINLPPRQNGSSIMPGKVNPVIPEVVTQVAYLVIGNDTAITMAAEAGQMELNAFEPVLFYKLFESLDTMAGAVKTLTENCIMGITANEDECRSYVEHSVGICTALCPYIGYKKAAEIAKMSLKTGVPVRDIVLRENLLSAVELKKILDPMIMTEGTEENEAERHTVA